MVDASTTNITLANLNPFRYRGYYFDTETNLYFLQTRYYDPEIGRFITIDDISYLDPETINGLNLYAYCGNNPVMGIDPSGCAPAWWQWTLSGLALVGGVALCFVPGAQAIGVGLIVAGASSMASNIMSAAGVDGKTEALISNGLNIVAGAILLATPFAAIGASMIGSGIGGIAGGFVSECFGGSFELGSAIGNIVGGFAGGQVYKGLTTTKLFRAVSSAEAASISKTGVFSEGAGQMEGKFFATSRANATTWGTKLGADKIVSVRVLRSGLSHESVTFFYRLDGIGKAYYFSDLSFLNSIVKNIRF